MTDYDKMTDAERAAELDKREKAATKRRQDLQREHDNLRLKYEDDLGEYGVAFTIVKIPEGCIVIALGAGALFKQFNAKPRSKTTGLPSIEDTIAFVAPCVKHPDQGRFQEIVDKRMAVGVICANALAALYQGDEDGATGKS